MAAITSNATGNWSATGTWVGGVVPGNGDTVTIANGHTVTVDVDTTIGASGVPAATAGTAAITITGNTAKLIIAAGRKLTLRGDILASSGADAHYWLEGQAGCILEFDSTLAADPANTKYSIGPTAAVSTGSSGPRFVGTAGARCQIRSKDGGGAGNFSQVASGTDRSYTMRFWFEFCDFYRIGDGTGGTRQAIYFSGNSSNEEIVVRSCAFDTCGAIFKSINGGDPLEHFHSSIWTNSQDSPIHIVWNSATNKPNAQILDCVFDRRIQVATGKTNAALGGVTIRDSFFRDFSGITHPATEMTANLLICDTSNMNVYVKDLRRNYIMAHRTSADLHVADVFCSGGGDNFHEENLIDNSGGKADDDYDGIICRGATTAAGICYFRKNLVIRPGNATGHAVCATVVSDITSCDYYLEKNTVVTRTAIYAAFKGSTVNEAATNAPCVQSLRSNLTVTEAASWKTLTRLGNLNVTDWWVPAEIRNNALNVSSGTMYEATGTGTPWSTPPAATGDLRGFDPQFVDAKRSLLHWDSKYLGNTAPAWSGYASNQQFAVGDIVSNAVAGWYDGDTLNYRCIAAHQKDLAGAMPGTADGQTWRTYWEPATFYRIREAIRGGVTYNGRKPIDALVEWVREGYAPQNTILKGAAHDGGDIGAVAVKQKLKGKSRANLSSGLSL